MSDPNKWWAGMWWSITPEAAHRLPSLAGPNGNESDDANIPREYSVEDDGTAVLSIAGVLGCAWFGTSYKALTAAALAADADPKVKAIRFDVNSPGGMVAGAHEAARAIHALSKPTVAMVSGEACSAAYWLSSACDRIEASPTAIIGCLGAMVTLMDFGGEDGPLVELRSSQTPRKNPAPKSEDAREQYQAVLDAQAAVFLQDVADFRGIPYTDVSTQYGEGAIMAATPALEAGMIDHVSGSATAEPQTGDADMAENKAATPDEQINELNKQLEEKMKLIKELEERLKKLEEGEGKDAGAESSAAADDMEDAPADEAPAEDEEDEVLATLKAKVSKLETDAAIATRDGQIDTLIAKGLITPNEKAVAVTVYGADPKLFAATYASRTEPVVDLGVHSHSAEGQQTSSDPEVALIAEAVAYCKANDIDHNGPHFAAAIAHVQMKS